MTTIRELTTELEDVRNAIEIERRNTVPGGFSVIGSLRAREAEVEEALNAAND